MSTPSLYARIVNGAVAEPLFTLPAGSTIEQCFVSVIAAEFVAVPAGVTPAPGWLYDGTTFTAPPAPTRTLAQQAQAALGAGLAVVSTGTPALNGTYALGSTTQLRMASLLQYYDKFGTFPNANASQVVVLSLIHI